MPALRFMPSATPIRVPASFPWASRWSYLARGVGLAPEAPVVVALSGGADSVLLLHLVARARPRPRVIAVHVDHALRGAESEADAAFCRELCLRLEVPFELRRAPLEPDSSNLEARARQARYAALVEVARGAEVATLLTGHHRDDQLETLLLRWLRGTELSGLAGLRARSELAPARDDVPALMAVRPLLGLRRAEIRHLLASEGIDWREDSSNESRRFTRNRLRTELLPRLVADHGDEAIEGLFAFAGAVEGLENELAARTAHLVWRPPAWATACRSRRDAHRGGTVGRAALAALPGALQRRALWRLLSEGTGHAPSGALLDLLLQDLATDARTRHSLPGKWWLVLRGDVLHLVPPHDELHGVASPGQPLLPFPTEARAHERRAALELRLGLPGLANLPDGRAIQAEIVSVAGAHEAPRRPDEVELDPGEGFGEVRELTVRWARPGDRFHGLGAPGSRPLGRFLADAGIPREERGRIPLVFADGELIWVAGVRPSERRRLRAGMARRLRLRLLGAPLEHGPQPGSSDTGLFGDAAGA